MADAPVVRCTTCGTEFSSTDSAQLENHAGHDLELIDPGADPTA